MSVALVDSQAVAVATAEDQHLGVDLVEHCVTRALLDLTSGLRFGGIKLLQCLAGHRMDVLPLLSAGVSSGSGAARKQAQNHGKAETFERPWLDGFHDVIR